MFEDSLWPDDALEQVFPDVGVDGAERVVKEIDVLVLVDGARQGYPAASDPRTGLYPKTHNQN